MVGPEKGDGMALLMARENFFVVIGGADVAVQKGDCWDSASAVAIAAPNQFGAAPNGTTTHRFVGQ